MLEAEGIGIVRGAKTLLSRVDLELTAGRLLALVGPNGAGKSTLLSVLSGAVSPTSGRVLLDSLPLDEYDAEALARRRAFLRQRFSVTSDFTASDVVRLGRTPHSAKGARSEGALVARLLEEVGLEGFGGRAYATLSGGEQQRVHLARVLAQLEGRDPQPRLLLLDEPSASLDPRHQHEVLGLVRARVERGYGAVVVLHDLSLAARYADDVVVLKRGEAVYAGPTRELDEHVLSDAFDVPIRSVAQEGARLWVALPPSARK